jgi:hypothetical protein
MNDAVIATECPWFAGRRAAGGVLVVDPRAAAGLVCDLQRHRALAGAQHVLS